MASWLTSAFGPPPAILEALLSLLQPGWGSAPSWRVSQAERVPHSSCVLPYRSFPSYMNPIGVKEGGPFSLKGVSPNSEPSMQTRHLSGCCPACFNKGATCSAGETQQFVALAPRDPPFPETVFGAIVAPEDKHQINFRATLFIVRAVVASRDQVWNWGWWDKSIW